MTRKGLEWQRPSVVEQATGVVLEIGFGSGLNLPFYKNVDRLYALDPSQELYELAQKRIGWAAFPITQLRASAEAIPLVDNSVNAVVSTWSLCSIPHPHLALREILRVLKPNGKFVFIEHGKSPKNLVARIQRFLTPVWKSVAGNCHLDREMDQLISQTNLQIQKMEKFQQRLSPLIFMYKGTAVKK